METQQMKITQTQDREITHLLTQVATGFEGWPSNVLDEFIVRIRAVVADEKRKNTNSARKKENIRLQCYGRALDALIADKIIDRDNVQAALDKVVESNVTRKLLGLTERGPEHKKKQRGRPAGSKNKAPKGRALVKKMENGADGDQQAELDTESAKCDEQQFEAQTNSAPSEQESQHEAQDTSIDEHEGQSDDQNGALPDENQFVQSEETDVQGLRAAVVQATTEETVDQVERDEKWAAQFSHRPGSRRERGGTWLGVPYKAKDEAKSHGARWDEVEGQWYTTKKDLSPFESWLLQPFRELHIDVPGDRVDVAKSLGAQYDPQHGYFIPAGVDLKPFAAAGFCQ